MSKFHLLQRRLDSRACGFGSFEIQIIVFERDVDRIIDLPESNIPAEFCHFILKMLLGRNHLSVLTPRETLPWPGAQFHVWMPSNCIKKIAAEFAMEKFVLWSHYAINLPQGLGTECNLARMRILLYSIVSILDLCETKFCFDFP